MTGRLARQARLVEDPPLRLQAVVHEAVLRNLVGGVDVMRGQLEHLTNLSQHPNISVQVLPFSMMNCSSESQAKPSARAIHTRSSAASAGNCEPCASSDTASPATAITRLSAPR
ncbi:Scr1 family TA system antitoxin-like transcriptional regulator [Streptomyces sp. NPDC050636]|uniref:Scr1 family TA system antitoxin-like transcriptional regulator n=1 Tax=Streptomyces sp. NPDC050636 TaxID=3154510 RepID=UPI00344A262B